MAVLVAAGCTGTQASDELSLSVAFDQTEPLKQAPSFTLPSASGGTISLDSYLGQSNLVLVFYQGFW